MRLIRAADATQAAMLAANVLATACREAVAGRGIAVIAVSGGETPWRMLERVAALDLPWQQLHVAQVDERLAPAGDPRLNRSRLEQLLVADGPLPRANLHPMPVEATRPLEAAAHYQRLLESLAGAPLAFDVVQLGLGSDGHTASLVPGDPVLEVMDHDVAFTGEYQGLRRMTLTFPALNRARRRLWLVTGAAKAARLAELLDGRSGDDAPATHVKRAEAVVVADEAAAAATGTRWLANDDLPIPRARDP